MSSRARITLKVAVWVGCLAPLAHLVLRALDDDLTANPIDYITDRLGKTALQILLLSLAMTPLRIAAGLSWPIVLRRLLGLFAFFYVALHFLVWALVDHFLNWPQMLEDIVKRPYITVGMAALATLIPLAATSTARMIKRLGGRRWRLLHRLAYAAGILAVVHFLWLAKRGVTEPYYYAAALGLLMAIRGWDWIRSARRRATMVAARGAP
jgi:methionine sulfoxide reductase heme-binding subunit